MISRKLNVSSNLLLLISSMSLNQSSPFSPLRFDKLRSSVDEIMPKVDTNGETDALRVGSLLSKSIDVPSKYLTKLYPTVENIKWTKVIFGRIG